ncbi:MAG: extracellular solute-binding protein [Chloroflexota bacterium]
MRPEHDMMRRLLRARMDRRRFLAASGATMGALAMGATRVARAQSPATADLGDTLNLATWPNYHSQETLDAFTAQTGVAVDMTVYGSTEEMEAKIRAGNSGIDVVVPSQYSIQAWTTDGLLEPLDYSQLPNVDLSTRDPLFVDQAFDPGNVYTIPKNWGTTGIAFWSDEVDPAPVSWADFFRMAGEDAYNGRFQIVDHRDLLDGLERPWAWATRSTRSTRRRPTRSRTCSSPSSRSCSPSAATCSRRCAIATRSPPSRGRATA